MKLFFEMAHFWANQDPNHAISQTHDRQGYRQNCKQNCEQTVSKRSHCLAVRSKILQGFIWLGAFSLTTLPICAQIHDPLVNSASSHAKSTAQPRVIDYVLPIEIENAMAQVQLNPAQISLVITPLGDKNASKLPLIEPDPFDLNQTDPVYGTDLVGSAPALPMFAHALSKPIHHFAKIPRTPASTMKLIPTFIALDSLGADFRWHTQVFQTGVQIGGDLYGDLILVGSGDPKFTESKLRRLLYQVHKRGIRRVHGDIILDTSVFRKVGKDPALFDGQPLRPYNASPDGLLVQFNTLTIASQPQADGRAALRYAPKLADFDLPISITQKNGGSCGNLVQSLAPKWQADRLVFLNALPQKCQDQIFYIAYPDVKDFAKKTVKAIWLELGNSLTGEIQSQEQDWRQSLSDRHKTRGLLAWRRPLPIADQASAPLFEQISDINHHSNNVMTEQVLLSLPIYQRHQNNKMPYRFSNYAKSLQFVQDWWRHTLTTNPPKMNNGSGLCRDCTVSAANLAELLNYAYQHPDFHTYLNALPIAGINGTIAGHAKRRPHSQAIGRAWIKTGTLDNVTAMAGYVKGHSGQDYSFVGIINADQAIKMRPVLDDLLDWLARH